MGFEDQDFNKTSLGTSENPNKPRRFSPEFQIHVSRDSESEEQPSILLQYGEVSFSVKANILNPEKFEVVTVSTGHDVAPDEIDRLKEAAKSAASEYIYELREKYSKYFI